MVESSFSPVPGGEQGDDLRQPRPRWVRRAAMPGRSANVGFSQYVSSRTVLIGGCPAVRDAAVAGPRRRSANSSER